MASFDLIEEPWIPCTIRGGPMSLGIRDLLVRAHEIDSIDDPSPLVEVALHRMLLAVLHRVFGPKTDDDWERYWEAGRWERDPLEIYFHAWEDRFDLFSETYPFYQAADLAVTDGDLTAYKMALELGPSNNRLFSHTDDANPPTLSPPGAARALVAYQSFNPGGLVRKRVGPGPTSGRSGPLAGAAVCLLTGRTLFQTLALNMVRYDGEGRPFPEFGTDRPAWEREKPPDDEQRYPHGYLDWLTWQSRSVRLAAETQGGETIVRRAVIARGNGLPAGDSAQPYEQMVAFRKRKDAKATEEAYSAVSFRRERAIWRDSAALLQTTEDTARPATLAATSDHSLAGVLEDRAAYPLIVCGVAFKQANALFWRSDRLPLSLRYLDDKALFGQLQKALGLAEDVARALAAATRVLAGHVLSIDVDAKLPKDRRDALDRRVAGMGAVRRFWAWLDPHFSRYLVDQAQKGDGAGIVWSTEVMRSAQRAFEDVAEGLGSDGDALRAEVEGRSRLERGLAKARKDRPYDQAMNEEAS
jgi:CRISPR system Cascade subunit CasA